MSQRRHTALNRSGLLRDQSAVPDRMTGRFPSGILKYARACNIDYCLDDVVDDGLVADSLLATTYRTNAGSGHSLTPAASISTVIQYFFAACSAALACHLDIAHAWCADAGHMMSP
jgi:hypothetical protein